MLYFKDYPGSNFSVEGWGLGWIEDHINGKSDDLTYSKTESCSFILVSAADAVGKPLILEEFGVSGLGTSIVS